MPGLDHAREQSLRLGMATVDLILGIRPWGSAVATTCRGMLRNKYRASGRNAAVTAALALALLTGGCGGGGVFGTQNAPEPDPAAPSFTDRITGFFSTSSARAPQAVSGAAANVSCPALEIREGASTLTVGPRGETMSLKYQGSFVRVARECAVVGGNMVMKIGVQGRIIIGPAGGAGQIDVPLRIAVVQERPGGSAPIITKFIRIPVTIPAQGDAAFTRIEEGLSFPLPTPLTALDDYIAYVGFDPLTAEAEDNQKAKPKPRAKPKPKPAAGSG